MVDRDGMLFFPRPFFWWHVSGRLWVARLDGSGAGCQEEVVNMTERMVAGVE